MGNITLWFQRTAQMFSCTRSLQSVMINILRYQLNLVRLVTIIFLYLTWVYNLLVMSKNMRKIVHSFPKTINFYEIHILMGTQQCRKCDDFVFGKENWPLPIRRGRWVVFRLMAKLLLSMMKPNCRCSLVPKVSFHKIEAD